MLEKTITFDRFVRGMLTALLIGAILFVVNYLSSVLLPFFIAWLLAYMLYPIVIFVQKKMKVPGRALSIIVTLVMVLGIIGGIVYLIIPPMIEQFEKLGELVTRYLHETTHVRNFPTVSQWLHQNSDEIQRFFRNKEVTEAIRNAMPKVFAVITETANVIISVIASLVTLIYLFFILLDYEVLSSGFIRMFPKKNRPFWRSLMDDVEKQLDSYIRGQGLVALCIGILFCIGLTIIGFPMAIGVGILMGLLSLVPYVHGFGLIPIALLAGLKAADTGQNFWVILLSALAVFVVVQLITDMVLTPKIMGKAMGLNPAILLLSLSVWGALLGFIGLIIALPLTTLLIAYYKRYVTKEETEMEEKETEK
ncbi:MAG: AI-2E family transporter [Prevotella sp.]